MAKESLIGSSTFHIVTLTTLSLLILKDFVSNIYSKQLTIPETRAYFCCFLSLLEMRTTHSLPNCTINVLHLVSTL